MCYWSGLRLPSICSGRYASLTRDTKKDELLVYGYCKESEKAYSNICIPYYLMDLMMYWMATEFIQIICCEGNISWGVNVDDILQAPREKIIKKRGRAPTPKQKTKCNECGKVFIRVQSVLRHQGKTKDGKLNCPVIKQRLLLLSEKE